MIFLTKWKETEIGTIPIDWEMCRLGDELIIKGRIGWKGLQKSEFSKDGECLIINGPDIREGKVNWGSCSRIPRWRYDESPEIMLKQGDILMTKDGTIGKMAFIEDLSEPATVASGIFVIRNNSKVLDQRYLYFIFTSPYFKNLIISRTEGSVIPHLYQRDITELKIPLPPLAIQKGIAKILSDLDSKIELNNQMNATLEAMAQAIFKHWFVDFEFPDENGKPYKSSGGKMVSNEKLGKEVPEGWIVKSIDQIADFLNGLALQHFPTKNKDNYLSIIKIRELKQGITDSSDKADVNIPKRYVVNNGDILFSWSGSLEVVIWCGGQGALNQHLFKVTSSTYPKWFYYYWILQHLQDYRQIAEGKATTMGHIQRHHLSDSLVLVPDSRTLTRMNNVLGPVIDKLIIIKLESENLSKICDSLLPKLMSGKIRVPIKVTS